MYVFNFTVYEMFYKPEQAKYLRKLDGPIYVYIYCTQSNK